MATTEQITTAVDQTMAIIAQMTAKPMPNVSINGESIDWAGYLSQLQQSMLPLLELRQALEGPYQRVTRMRT
jgi:hypothetical protein